jgi:hypothetical protein
MDQPPGEHQTKATLPQVPTNIKGVIDLAKKVSI